MEEFRGLQKRVERGEWLTSMPLWVERPAPREEGRQKSGLNRIGAQQDGRGVREGTVFSHRVDLQLRISNNLGIMTKVACTENLRLPVGAYGREICLQYRSEGE